MVAKCLNALSANVYYYYENHPFDDPLWAGVIVSAHPGLIVTVGQLNKGQTECELHYVTITAPLVSWTERYRGGVEYEVGYFERTFSAYGPISDLKVEIVSDLNNYYGFEQKVSIHCRGLFGYAGCTDLDYYEIPFPRGGSGNNYLWDTSQMKVGGIRNWNDPDVPPYRFSIIDGDGLVYDRTEFDRPHVTYIECVGSCIPGGSRIGGCCVDCSDLTGSLEAIRQAMRRI